ERLASRLGPTVNKVEKPQPAVPVNFDPVWSVWVDHQAVRTRVFNSVREVVRPARGFPRAVATLPPLELRKGDVQLDEQWGVDRRGEVGGDVSWPVFGGRGEWVDSGPIRLRLPVRLSTRGERIVGLIGLRAGRGLVVPRYLLRGRLGVDHMIGFGRLDRLVV